MNNGNRDLREEGGFSLLELLVAFTIMAMALGMIYNSMGGSARQTAELIQRQQALMLAESLLNERESVTPQGWQDSGETGAFRWQINSQLDPANMPGALPMHIVSISVSWLNGDGRRLIEARTLLPQRQPAPGEVTR